MVDTDFTAKGKTVPMATGENLRKFPRDSLIDYLSRFGGDWVYGFGPLAAKRVSRGDAGQSHEGKKSRFYKALDIENGSCL
jgi:hypothetical protein